MKNYSRLLLVSLLLVSSCLDYQETLRLLPDGRIELEVYATAVKAMLPMIANRPEWKGLLLLPATLEEARQSYALGVQVKRWYIEEGAGVVVYDFAVTIENPPALSQLVREIQSNQKVELFLDEKGLIHYRRELPPLARDALPAPFAQLLREQFENSRLRFRIVSPSGIVRANGIQVSPEEVIWETGLLKLRSQGLVMLAEIRAPSFFERYPLFQILLLLGLVTVLLWGTILFLRKRRRKGTPPPLATGGS